MIPAVLYECRISPTFFEVIRGKRERVIDEIFIPSKGIVFNESNYIIKSPMCRSYESQCAIELPEELVNRIVSVAFQKKNCKATGKLEEDLNFIWERVPVGPLNAEQIQRSQQSCLGRIKKSLACIGYSVLTIAGMFLFRITI